VRGRATVARPVATRTALDPGKDARWSIGDPGRAFAEVVPVLGDPAEGPDTIADVGTVGSVHLVAASVRGLSHQQNGTPRQDSYGFAYTADKAWLVVVVADGVSAGPLSHRAAQLVARHAPGRVIAEFAEVGDVGAIDWYKIFEDLAKRVLRIGQKLLIEKGAAEAAVEDVPDAMATTATIAVVEISPPGDERRVAYAWLGDSPIWRVDNEGVWQCLTEVKNAGQDVPKSSVNALPRLPSEPVKLPHDCRSIPADAMLLLMTDGVGDPLGAADGEVAARLAEVWRRPPNMFRFAEQVAFGRKSFDDDRTVVAVWPRTEP
jgi:serine/threonine protein phosphatase PrpC